jgi:acetate kinase
VTTTTRTIVVMNAGRSTVRGDVFTWPGEENAYTVEIDRVGAADAFVRVLRDGGESEVRPVQAPDVRTAVALVLDTLDGLGVKPSAMGHRVMHGGEKFTDSARLTDDVISEIRKCVPLAPLHNPAALDVIELARVRHPDVVHVAVFETAFHQTLPREAFLYALPREHYDEARIRRYGFHGTSHRYVAERAAVFFGRPPSSLRLITLHLGRSSSACAVDGGKSVDTSMGMTALEGLPSSTRSGDVDPSVVLQLARTLGIDATEKLLQEQSGMFAVSRGVKDMRDLEKRAAEGDAEAELAIRMFTRRVRKQVGAYAALMGGIDGVVFTGSIGEHSARVRREVCEGLVAFGVVINDRRNESAAATGERDLAGLDSRARILVIPTAVARAVATDTYKIAFNKTADEMRPTALVKPRPLAASRP